MDEFAAGLHGKLIREGVAYDEMRKVYNAMIDRKPAIIVRCVDVQDVIQAVNFARDRGLLVAVRGGGHNVAGNAVCDGGLVIDLSALKGIRIDPDRRTALVQPGVTWAEFDRTAQAHGLATTGGVVSTTGVAGLTLGGGLGWLMRKHGLACDNLRAVEIVTADGIVRRANAKENPDLFWAVRGGGGNFGVVTSFEYRLHPVGQVLGGLVIHPLDRAGRALRFYRKFTEGTPDELGTLCFLVTSPDGAPVLAVAVCYNGPIEQGERVLRPLREYGPPVADEIGPMPYSAVQSMFDSGFRTRRRNYWKSDFLMDLSDDAIDTMVRHFTAVQSPYSGVAIEHLGGAVSRVGVDETAFPHRNAPFDLLIMAIWEDPGEDASHIQWARDFWSEMRPFSTGGVYVNYLGGTIEEGAERVRSAYGLETYDRLAVLKHKYDSGNLFRLNQNIRPA